jgi:hypothetical protein
MMGDCSLTVVSIAAVRSLGGFFQSKCASENFRLFQYATSRLPAASERSRDHDDFDNAET